MHSLVQAGNSRISLSPSTKVLAHARTYVQQHVPATRAAKDKETEPSFRVFVSRYLCLFGWWATRAPIQLHGSDADLHQEGWRFQAHAEPANGNCNTLSSRPACVPAHLQAFPKESQGRGRAFGVLCSLPSFCDRSQKRRCWQWCWRTCSLIVVDDDEQ